MPTSSKSTATEPAKRKRTPDRVQPSFTDLKGDGAGDQKDDALAALELQLQAEKDARLEERFVWIVVSVILVDVIWFQDAANATIPVVVMILQLIALMVLARRMGVDDYVQLLGRILASIGNKGAG